MEDNTSIIMALDIQLFRSMALTLSLVALAACQSQAIVENSDLPDRGSETEPAYSELTRLETEETIRRLQKIRQAMTKNRPTRYTGPIRHIWDRIHAGKQINYEDNLRIEKQATYLLRDREYLNRVSQRAAPFIYFILEEIDKRGLPPELALLPVIESAYRPTAISKSRAVGLWQFIEPTSKFLGMKKTWWYDARRDAVISTHYALDYLAMLNEKFDGDWLLALAAYNGGHGRISRAIENNRRAGKPLDYWSLDLLPETTNYVPRFLAASRIFTRPENYDVTLFPVPNKPHFDSINTKKQIDIVLSAEASDMDYQKFKTLNAGYLRRSTPPTGTHRLLLPLDKLKQFKLQLTKSAGKKQLLWGNQYKIRTGDTLSAIASRYGVAIEELKAANQLADSKIIAGSSLQIPSKIPAKTPTKTPAAVKKYQAAVHHLGHSNFHTVRVGDTLWNIAKRYQVSIDQLLSMNKLSYSSVIKPGQRLRIRSKKKQLAFNQIES